MLPESAAAAQHDLDEISLGASSILRQRTRNKALYLHSPHRPWQMHLPVAHVVTGERLDVQLYIIPELSIGPVTQKQVLVGARNGLNKFHLDGIIAFSFFRNQPFTLDFQHHQFLVETRASLAHRRNARVPVSIQLDDQRGVSLDVFAPFLADSQPGECELDTGSQGYIFSSRYMKRLRLDTNGSVVKKSEHISILGNKELRYNPTFPALQLDGNPSTTRQEAPAVFEDIIYDCNIGTDF